jgi:hypothetical protein
MARRWRFETNLMSQQSSLLSQLWAKTDTPGVRAFFLSILALGVALLLAVYSGAAAELGNIGLAASSALLALAIAGWVAVTMVPTLAKGGCTSGPPCWWPSLR